MDNGSSKRRQQIAASLDEPFLDRARSAAPRHDLRHEVERLREEWRKADDGWIACRQQLQGAVSLDDPELIGTLARVIENRHGTLHGIGDTLREALAELKRSRGTR